MTIQRSSRSAFIPMVDLQPLHVSLSEPISAAVANVIRQGDFIQGSALERFEHHAAHYLGVRHAVGVASGTDALFLALLAAGIGPGDEVITTPFSFWATAEAIYHAGAQAVYVDIDEQTMNIDPALIEAAITPKTRAILPVHIFGQSADMGRIMEIANRHKLIVIEDAAQAFGTTFHDQKVGSFGLAGCFSFYPSKPLGGFGDGGLIATDNDELANKIRRLSNHGSASRYQHSEFGYNSRLDSLQAAILDVKLQHLDTHLAERRRLSDLYMEKLAGLPVQLPDVNPECNSAVGQFTLRSKQRDQLQQHLQTAGIASAVHYATPLYRQAANRHNFNDFYLPVAESTCQTCLSLPLYQGLSPENHDAICEQIRGFFHAQA